MKKNIDNFWEWVNNRRVEIGIDSFRELERRSGFSPGAIGKRKNAHKLPTAEMAEGMYRALRVSWCELWEKAGFAQPAQANQLTGLDAEIFRELDDTGEDFKQAVLKTIKTWLILYEELRRDKQ